MIYGDRFVFISRRVISSIVTLDTLYGLKGHTGSTNAWPRGATPFLKRQQTLKTSLQIKPQSTSSIYLS